MFDDISQSTQCFIKPDYKKLHLTCVGLNKYE